MRLSATLAAALLAATLSCIPAYPLNPEIRDIDVTVTLLPDGTAEVSERWDVCAASGTEWYLVRRNLGDIRIGGLEVSDESGRSYVNEGEWDTDRSISEKAGRCGIVTKDDGAEICWGIGSLGDHVFNVSYSMTRSVKTLSDYDMLHLQTVSPGLSSEPEHVKVTVRALEHRLDTTNTRAWGFGYRGRVDFLDGEVVFESTEPFVRNSSVIVLLRFEKGLFDSPSVQDRSFGDVLATAMEGSDFSGSDDGSAAAGFGKLLGLFMLGMTAMVGAGIWHRHSTRKKILGVKPSEVVWSREIPFGGDLEASARTLDRLGYKYSSDTLAAALIGDKVHQLSGLDAAYEILGHARAKLHLGAAHHRKHELGARNDGGRPEAPAQGKRTDVAHEDLGRMRVEPKEGESRPRHGRHDDGGLFSPGNRGEVSTRSARPGHVGEEPQSRTHENDGKRGETVEAVRQIDGVARAHDHDVDENDEAENPEGEGHLSDRREDEVDAA